MALIIPSGGNELRSFNDDTSPDSRLTSDQKVVVNGQVMPESSLDWYYRILNLCGSVTGELKSADVWPRLRAVGGESKQRIWAGLSKVRLHIVDPRPYQSPLRAKLREWFRCDDPHAFLRQQVALKDPTAMLLSKQIRIYTAGRILDDSVAARVHRVSKFIDDGFNPDEGDVVYLNEFGLDERALGRKVSAWAAKSAAAFHKALDDYLELDEDTRLSVGLHMRIRMQESVSQTHAFDKGNENQIKLLMEARESILRYLTGPQMKRVTSERYTELNSVDSFLVQAADIAAGIASKIIETQSLVAVVSAFEYVTYNGSRVSIAEMEEEIRRMDQ